MKVVSFYRFTDIKDAEILSQRLLALCENEKLLGTVLVAAEGINGTLAGEACAVQRVLDWLQLELALLEPLEGRWTEAGAAPFRRMRVRVKSEIVTLGRPDILPQRNTARHVSPRDWNNLLDDAGTLVIDTRNRYEVEVGSFPGAVNPATDSFRQFAAFVDNLASALSSADRNQPVAMFCTGGIRCEKASALMLEMGFSEVYQLQGGILNYLEQVNPADNRWQGECFVFDSRVAVDRDLAEGGYVQCHACRRPLGSEDLASPDYREGVSCPRCVHDLEADRAVRLEERRRQVVLARQRGDHHIGKQQPQKQRR